MGKGHGYETVSLCPFSCLPSGRNHCLAVWYFSGTPNISYVMKPTFSAICFFIQTKL